MQPNLRLDWRIAVPSRRMRLLTLGLRPARILLACAVVLLALALALHHSAPEFVAMHGHGDHDDAAETCLATAGTFGVSLEPGQMGARCRIAPPSGGRVLSVDANPGDQTDRGRPAAGRGPPRYLLLLVLRR